ncbi:MAG: hypothetical protein K0R14_1822 [Burkholderiales bacterium]|nr:hypothetical protein [Burkholderiales bacterium]
MKSSYLKYYVAILLGLVLCTSYAGTHATSCDYYYKNDNHELAKLGTISWVIKNNKGTKEIRFIKPDETTEHKIPIISPIIKTDNEFQIGEKNDKSAVFTQMMAIKGYRDTNSTAFIIPPNKKDGHMAGQYEIVYPAVGPEAITPYRLIYNGTYNIQMNGAKLHKLTFSLNSTDYTGYDRPPRDIIYEIDVSNKKASRRYQFGDSSTSAVVTPVVDDFSLDCKSSNKISNTVI